MNKDESDYLKGGAQPLATASSILISSSKYLNSAAMRNVVAQEMLRKVGTDLPPAYFIPEMNAAFNEVTDYPYILQLLAAERARLPEFAAWLDARFLSDFTPAAVAEFRPGTLGELVHGFVVESGFDIDFMFKGAPADDYQYWLKRFVQSHDIQHMVTGFDVTPIGEYALIMLNTVNYCDYFCPELAAELTRHTTLQVTCGMMRANLHYPRTLPLLLEALALGRAMARDLRRPLFYVKWEDYWDNSVAEIREDLNIRGAPAPDAWAWAYEEMRNMR
jgi:ubiquinone biosynthesis protein Coq4